MCRVVGIREDPFWRGDRPSDGGGHRAVSRRLQPHGEYVLHPRGRLVRRANGARADVHRAGSFGFGNRGGGASGPARGDYVSAIHAASIGRRMRWLLCPNLRKVRPVFRTQWRDSHRVVPRGKEVATQVPLQDGLLDTIGTFEIDAKCKRRRSATTRSDGERFAAIDGLTLANIISPAEIRSRRELHLSLIHI